MAECRHHRVEPNFIMLDLYYLNMDILKECTYKKWFLKVVFPLKQVIYIIILACSVRSNPIGYSEIFLDYLIIDIELRDYRCLKIEPNHHVTLLWPRFNPETFDSSPSERLWHCLYLSLLKIQIAETKIYNVVKCQEEIAQQSFYFSNTWSDMKALFVSFPM